jgi:hypothetical protein
MRVVQFSVQSGCRVLRREIGAACERLVGIAHSPDRSPYEL